MGPSDQQLASTQSLQLHAPYERETDRVHQSPEPKMLFEKYTQHFQEAALSDAVQLDLVFFWTRQPFRGGIKACPDSHSQPRNE